MKIVPQVLLKDFRAYLMETLGNQNTADRYFYAVCRFFEENRLETLAGVTPERVLAGLEACRTRNASSALKIGLKHLSTYDQAVRIPSEEEMKEIQFGKRDRSVRPAKTIYLETVQATLRRLGNKKLEYAYRLMMVSGLRVSEAAALERKDIQCSESGIQVRVRHGKGGSNGLVHCLRDRELERCLPKYLAQLGADERPFYSAKTMKNAARELGLECHDFRRIAAIQYRGEKMRERKEAVEDVPTVEEVDQQTRDFLRHKRFSTTKRYLYNRKLKVRGEEADEERGELSAAKKL